MSKGLQGLVSPHVSDAGFALTSESLGASRAAITVHGELDILTVPELRSALAAELAAATTRIVIDLTDVSFIDSVSLAAIVNTKRQLGPDGVLCVALAPDSYSTLIFEIGGMDSIVELFDSREAAVAHLDG